MGGGLFFVKNFRKIHVMQVVSRVYGVDSPRHRVTKIEVTE